MGNYFLASQSVPTNNSLGTSIYVHHSVTYDNINFNTSEFQISGIKLYLTNNNNFLLFNIYNQPSFNYDLNNLSVVIPNINEDFLLVGDFNAHSPVWDTQCSQADTNGSFVENLVETHDLCILNDNEVNTYYSKTHSTFSSVDLTICSTNLVDRYDWHVIEDLYTSDHFPILISCLGHSPTPTIKQYNTNKADWNKFKICTMKIPPFSSSQDHDTTTDFFTDFVIQAAEKSIPSTTSRPKKRSVPWWSDTLAQLIKEKHTIGRKLENLNKRFKIISNESITSDNKVNKLIALAIEISILKPHFNKISAKFRKEAIRGRITSWQKYVNSLSDYTSTSNVWEKFRKINGSYTKSPRHALLHNGVRIHDTHEVSNILGRNIEYISSIHNLDVHFRTIKTRTEKIPLNFDTLEDIYYNRKFTEEELEYALSNCSSSTPGYDKITFDMLSNLAPLSKSYLLQFYNHLWSKHLFPKAWKHAIVIPISKPGKDPSNPNNYRPISLTSCLCKLLEKMVNFRLNWYLRKNKTLSPFQFGCQSERSTLDSLSHLENYIRRGFERKQITVAVFFDIQKAYDTTWRYSVIKSLHENGFRGHLPVFIKNFIYGRTFQTRVDGIYSDTFQLDNGVPQGSVLSGTLFALAIDNITSQLPQGIQHNLYVDDFAIYYSSSNLRHLQRMLNTAIRKIFSWTQSVGFKLSIDKTQAMMFYRNIRWKRNQDIHLNLGNNHIQFKETIKFLGLVFDSHLNWKAHVTYVKAKCKGALNLIRKVSHTSWGAKRSTLLTLYKALVLSRIDYGCPVYGSATEATLRALDPIHAQGLRLCSGAFRSSPVSSVLCESGEPPLSLHRDLVTMRSALKILSSNSPTRQLFQSPDIFINNHTPPFPIRANRLLESTQINFTLSPPINFPPPWTVTKANICCHLNYLSKKHTLTPNHHKQQTLEHIQKKGQHNAIFTDGSKSSAGVGCAAVSTTKCLQSSLPKEATVFTSELTAILMALNMVKTFHNARLQKNIIYTDSKSSIEALKAYTHKNRLVNEIKDIVSKLQSVGINIEFCWIPAHVGIMGNEKADEAAKTAINFPKSNIIPPVNDYITTLKTFIRMKWQQQWDEEHAHNKLKMIKLMVTFWDSSVQKEKHIEVILTRLRIGHTRLTHGYLMSTPHDPVPYCNSCNVILSVQHILSECTDFSRERTIYFNDFTLTDILGDSPRFSVNRILSFLRNIRLIHKI